MTPCEQQLIAQLEQCRQALSAAQRENQLLRQKIEALARRIFGVSSEALDPAQLQLLLQMPELKPVENPPAPLTVEKPRPMVAVRKHRAPRLPERAGRGMLFAENPFISRSRRKMKNLCALCSGRQTQSGFEALVKPFDLPRLCRFRAAQGSFDEPGDEEGLRTGRAYYQLGKFRRRFRVSCRDFDFYHMLNT